MKGLISDRPFNIGDRRDFDIVENTERLNQLPRLQNSRVFCSQGKASLQFSLGWFALSSSAKPRFDRLKRELLEVYNIILKFKSKLRFFSLEYLCPQTLLEQWKVFSWIYGQEVPLRMPVWLHGRTLRSRWLCGQQTQTYLVPFSLDCTTKNTFRAETNWKYVHVNCSLINGIASW